DDTILAQKPSHVVDKRSPSADNALPRSMKRLQILLLSGFDRNESHRRAKRGFIDSLCVRRVVLGSLHERLHKPGIDQQDSASIGQQASTPEMGAGASLHGNGFRSGFLDRLKQLGAAHLPRKDYPIAVNAVTVKRALPEIDGE